MGRSTVHYADNQTNTILKKLHNKLRLAGTPVQRVEYIIELLLLRIFEVRLKQDPDFVTLRKLFDAPNDGLLFSSLYSVANERLLAALNEQFFPFYSNILGHARKVYTGNLSQKVQDQLVLIEEVFANSNFTNNVKSGNLQEIISLITDIEDYEPSEEEIKTVQDWAGKPDIYLDEGLLQKIFDYPAGSIWDFFLHVLGKRKIPTPVERIQMGFDSYISTADFNDDQLRVLKKIKEVFASNLASRGTVDVDSIFANPIYERLIGNYETVNKLFDGNLRGAVDKMQKNFQLTAY